MSRLAALLPDVLVVLGLVAVAVGAGWVSEPAVGLILGGVEAVAFGLLLDGRVMPYIRSRAETVEGGHSA